MSGTCGPTSRQPLAYYDPESSCWRTSQQSLLSPRPESLQTLPAWVTWDQQALYELPTSGPATDEPAGSASRTLPTPRSQMGESRNNSAWVREDGPQNLENALALLPTPRTSDANGGGHARGRGPGPEDDDQPVAWGDYEPAIRRHEHALGRPAPEPIVNGKQVSARFVEWMQGYPAGWVTDVIASRNACLRLLGNSIVPPQMAHALDLLTTPER